MSSTLLLGNLSLSQRSWTIMKRRSKRLHWSNRKSVSCLVQLSSWRCCWYSRSEYTGMSTAYMYRKISFLHFVILCSSVLYLQYLLQTIIAKCVKNIQCYSCSEVEIKNKSLYSYSYLIKACKRIIFSFICYSSPVIKNSTVLL